MSEDADLSAKLTSEPVKVPQEGRTASGRFRPGYSGNVAGRNQYTGRKAFQNELLAHIDVGMETKADQRAIWSKFLALCRQGDAWALKAYLERRWPIRRGDLSDGPMVVVRNYTGEQHEPPLPETLEGEVVSSEAEATEVPTAKGVVLLEVDGPGDVIEVSLAADRPVEAEPQAEKAEPGFEIRRPWESERQRVAKGVDES